MNDKIEEYRELLSVLPRNNIKNNKKYYETAKGIKEEFITYKHKLLDEIKRRIVELEIDNSIKLNFEEDIKLYKDNLRILNDYNDYYEKSFLDITLKNISKYYNNNLYKVNYDIYSAIKIFKQIGIEIVSEDFNFGREASQYMKVFFEENDINSVKLKESFEKLYWKSPNFILFICINFKYLYRKNIKKFKQYYDGIKQEVFPMENIKYINEYKDKLRKNDEMINNHIGILQKRFIDDELEIKAFAPSKIEASVKDLTIDPKYNYQNEDNFINLENTLKEYKKYMENKFVIDEVIKLHKEKIGKNEIKNIIKSISKKEKNIIKINKKILFNYKFRGKKYNPEKKYIKINGILNSLIEEYDKYENLKFKNAVSVFLSEESTYLDALSIANSFKNSLVNILKEKDDDMDIVSKLDEIEKFVYSPYNTIINNIMLFEEKDIIDIICDKYKLMNIKLEEDSLKDNLELFINIIETINIFNILKNNNVIYDDLLFLVEAKKIIKNNE